MVTRGNARSLIFKKSAGKVNLISKRCAIIGQQFFFFSLFPFFLLEYLPFALFLSSSRLSPGEQLGQKLRKLVKGRIRWKSGYCEWQLAVHYSWITRLLRRGGEPQQRARQRAEEREREREWKNEKKREKKRQRQIVVERVRGTRSKSFPVETSKTVLTTQQNTGRFVRLSLNVLHSKDSP